MEKGYKDNAAYHGYDPNSPIAHIILANAANAHLKKSMRFADKVQEQFVSSAKRESRGVKQSGFLVLWRTSMPSVLVEIGFLTNKKDENYLETEKGQMEVASNLYKAFRDYKKEVELAKDAKAFTLTKDSLSGYSQKDTTLKK